MTTATEFISQALRESNLIPTGTSPTTAELTEGLARLNAFLRSLFGIEIGEHLADWQVPDQLRTAPVTANFPQFPFPAETLGDAVSVAAGTDRWPYPPQNSRLICGLSAAATVYFPEQPNDGARMAFVAAPAMAATLTLDGNGRTIETATTQALTSATATRSWFYRADLSDWRLLADLALSDDSPLSSDMDDLIVCGLSIRLSPRFGQEPRAGTSAMYQKMMVQAKTRYKQAGTTVSRSGEVPRGLQSYPHSRWMG